MVFPFFLTTDQDYETMLSAISKYQNELDIIEKAILKDLAEILSVQQRAEELYDFVRITEEEEDLDATAKLSDKADASKEVIFGTLEGKKTGKDVGKVDQLQKEGKNIPEAKTGDKVAVSMEEPTMGRQINEKDVLVSVITRGNIQGLKEVWDKLQDDEKLLLKEWELV